jgi:DNA-binding CsgD family transcriptional regulator
VPFFLEDGGIPLWRLPVPSGVDGTQTGIALRERIKELNCLYGIAQLAERHQSSIVDFLRDLANFLPPAWQYTENTSARIIFKGQTYTSGLFQPSRWSQVAQIYMYREIVGECAVFYAAEYPAADEGPFLKEERALLDAVAEQIGIIATRMAAEKELQETNHALSLERQALKETNIALRVVLARIEKEKQEIYRDISTNVDKILLPVLQALAPQLSTAQAKYLDLLKSGITEITSPFLTRLSHSYHSLTPTETAISNMIKNGLRTKEIAEIRGVTESTVNRHREKIRYKLKITHEKINLATFLQSILVEN